MNQEPDLWLRAFEICLKRVSWELDSGSLQEQYEILTAESFLQPLGQLLFVCLLDLGFVSLLCFNSTGMQAYCLLYTEQMIYPCAAVSAPGVLNTKICFILKEKL